MSQVGGIFKETQPFAIDGFTIEEDVFYYSDLTILPLPLSHPLQQIK